MKSEEQFDELLKNKFSHEADFSFSEDKWARMEELIILQEQKSKRRKFAFFYISGFFSALILVLPFTLLKNLETDHSGTKTSQKNKKEITKIIRNKDTKKLSFSAKGVNENKIINRNKNRLVDVIKEQNFIQMAKYRKTKFAVSSPNENNELITSNKIDNLETDSFKLKSTPTDSTKLVELAIEKISDSLTQEKSDTTQEIKRVEKIDMTEIKTQEPVKHLFSLSLGLLYNLGYSNKEGQSLSPLFGLQYSYNEKWLIGLAYQNVSKLNYEKEFISTSYDFGYRNKTTLIKQINLHYIALPLAYQYSFKQNSINLGISPCIMIFNKSIINEKTITPFYEDLGASNPSYAYSHGLSTVDIQLSLGYKRIVSKKLTIGIDYNLGLVDVRNKSWTNNTNIERNKFISLKLNYKIR